MTALHAINVATQSILLLAIRTSYLANHFSYLITPLFYLAIYSN